MKKTLGELRAPYMQSPVVMASMARLKAVPLTARLVKRIKRLDAVLLPEVQATEQAMQECRKKHGFGNGFPAPGSDEFDEEKVKACLAEEEDLLKDEVELEINVIELPPEAEGVTAKLLCDFEDFVAVKGCEKDPEPVKIIRKAKEKVIALPEKEADTEG